MNLGQRSAYECGLGADGNDHHRSVIVLVAKFVQALSSGDTGRSYLELHQASVTNRNLSPVGLKDIPQKR